MHKFLLLVKKDLLLIVREPSTLVMILLLPLILATIFGAINSNQGQPTTINIAVVDDDGSETSQAYLQRLADNESVDIKVLSLDEAQSALRRSTLTAILVVKSGFGDALLSFPMGTQSPEVEIISDPKRQAVGNVLLGTAMTAAVEMIDERISSGFNAPAGGLRPLNVISKPYEVNRPLPISSFEITIPQAILWSILSCVAIMSTSLSIERVQHTILRLQTSPTSIWMIIASKVASCMASILAATTMILLFGLLIFGVRLQAPFAMLIAVLSAGYCFAGLMLAIGSIGTNISAVAGTAWATMVLFALLGGGMIPQFVMPDWMATISSISPGKWAILAIEGAIWREFSAAELVRPVLVLILIGLGGISIGVTRLRGRSLAP